MLPKNHCALSRVAPHRILGCPCVVGVVYRLTLHNVFLVTLATCFAPCWVDCHILRVCPPSGIRCVRFLASSVHNDRTQRDFFACAMLGIKWSERRGSNPRHQPWKGRTLPTELRSHEMEHRKGLEPSTSSMARKLSGQLRYRRKCPLSYCFQRGLPHSIIQTDRAELWRSGF